MMDQDSCMEYQLIIANKEISFILYFKKQNNKIKSNYLTFSYMQSTSNEKNL